MWMLKLINCHFSGIHNNKIICIFRWGKNCFLTFKTGPLFWIGFYIYLIYIYSKHKNILSSFICIKINLIDSLRLLQLIQLMCKLQPLSNNTFYLITAALIKCFKTGQMWILAVFIISTTIIATNVRLSQLHVFLQSCKPSTAVTLSGITYSVMFRWQTCQI